MLMRQILANAALATPGAIAARDGDPAVTYEELNDLANRLPTVLLEHACGVGKRGAPTSETHSDMAQAPTALAPRACEMNPVPVQRGCRATHQAGDRRQWWA